MLSISNGIIKLQDNRYIKGQNKNMKMQKNYDKYICILLFKGGGRFVYSNGTKKSKV